MSFKSTVTTAIKAAVGAAAFSLVAIGAHAAEVGVPQSVTVEFDSLDLSKATGTEALYSRLRGAARGVCNGLEGRDLKSRKDYAECYRHALDNAVKDVNNARLSALHNTESNVRIASRSASDRN